MPEGFLKNRYGLAINCSLRMSICIRLKFINVVFFCKMWFISINIFHFSFKSPTIDTLEQLTRSSNEWGILDDFGSMYQLFMTSTVSINSSLTIDTLEQLTRSSNEWGILDDFGSMYQLFMTSTVSINSSLTIDTLEQLTRSSNEWGILDDFGSMYQLFMTSTVSLQLV